MNGTGADELEEEKKIALLLIAARKEAPGVYNRVTIFTFSKSSVGRRRS